MRGSGVWRLAIAGALLIAIGACNAEAEEPQNAVQAGESDSGQQVDAPPDWCPLTGEDPAAGVELDRPAVAVKIENSPDARPQAGLDRADLVFEERVEGGITRFLVVYHCADSAKAGPVRSGRFDDPKLAKPFTRLITASGSNSIVEREMKAQKMVYLDEDSTDALFRDPPGLISTHSLFVNTKKLRKTAVSRKLSPPSYEAFEFGPIEGDSRRARSVSVNFTDSNTIEYKWREGAWKRFEAGAPFTVASGEQIAVPNLLIQIVDVDNSDTIFDVAGNPSPDISLERSGGKALLFRDGRVVKGTWSFGKVGDIPVYETKGGDPLPFAEGPIWVALVPSQKGEVKGKFTFK